MSATGSSGRRRTTARLYTAEDQALNQIAREAEARLAAKRAARAEAREIRMRELEKQQREADEQSDRHYEIMNDISTRPMTSRVSTKSSGSSYSSRRSSEDSIEVDRDMKAQLSDIEEKFRKAMVSNAQLDNEKTTLTYQVETLKDEFEELEENTVQLQREHKDKCKDLDLLKRDYEKLKQENSNLLEQLQEREKLIEEHGLVLVGGEEINNIDEDETDTPKGVKERNPAALVSPEAAQILESAGDGSLDIRLKKFAEDKQDLLDQIRRLKLELEEEKTKNATLGLSPGKTLLNGPEMQLLEVQREANKQISEYKFRLQKAEQDISTLQGNINRLDSQVKRYKSAADKADVVEDELKAEKRKLQREYREAQARIEELETANSHLQKRLDKLKTSRNAMTRS